MDAEIRFASPLRDYALIGASIGDLKRMRDARSADSLATRGFCRAWARLGEVFDIRALALETTADALVATRLGAIDAAVLAEADVIGGEAILRRAFDDASLTLDPALRNRLSSHIGQGIEHGPVPAFASSLVRQPRAGATCAGKPRVILEPAENHGEHCFVVATLGVLLSPGFGADPSVVFCAGLAHHLHNAYLPDSGYAGELLLGDELEPLMARLFERALCSLPPHVADVIRRGLAVIIDASTPEGRAFHAADVLDRVLQMRHYENAARFTTRQALDDLDLVHAGPIQAFHRSILSDAGLA